MKDQAEARELPHNSHMERSRFKYLVLLTILYATTQLTTIVLAYRLFQFGAFLEPGGILIFPLSYIIGDIITEVYGYKYMRQTIWATTLSIIIFSILVQAVINLPTPAFWTHASAYNDVLGANFRAAFANVIGTTAGGFLNVYALSKWKILVKGKHFALRSIASNMLGEAVATIMIATLLFIGKISTFQLIDMMVSMYIFKLIYVFVLAGPASFITMMLKQAEDHDPYDIGINFNPFKFA